MSPCLRVCACLCVRACMHVDRSHVAVLARMCLCECLCVCIVCVYRVLAILTETRVRSKISSKIVTPPPLSLPSNKHHVHKQTQKKQACHQQRHVLSSAMSKRDSLRRSAASIAAPHSSYSARSKALRVLPIFKVEAVAVAVSTATCENVTFIVR